MLNGIIMIAVIFWVVIGIIVVANGYFVFQVRAARYRVMQTLAEKGQPVPVELLTGSNRSAPNGFLRGGIVLVCVGLTLMAFFWSMTAESWFHGPIQSAAWLPTIGLFPLMIGVALLLLALFERNRPHP